MAKQKKKVEDESEIIEEETVQPLETPEQPVSTSNEELETKRNELINDLRPKLVTKRQMVVGGREVRSKVSQEESNYRPIIEEINKIGLELGLVDVNIGMLRRD